MLNALNAVRQDLLDELLAAGNVYVDIGMLEGTGGIESLLKHVSLDRVLFGSYAPFFAFEAAELKLRESPLAEAQREAIRQGNARQLAAFTPTAENQSSARHRGLWCACRRG